MLAIPGEAGCFVARPFEQLEVVGQAGGLAAGQAEGLEVLGELTRLAGAELPGDQDTAAGEDGLPIRTELPSAPGRTWDAVAKLRLPMDLPPYTVFGRGRPTSSWVAHVFRRTGSPVVAIH